MDNNTFILAQVKGCSPQQPFFLSLCVSKTASRYFGERFLYEPWALLAHTGGPAKACCGAAGRKSLGEEGAEQLCWPLLAPGTAALPEHSRALSSTE